MSATSGSVIGQVLPTPISGPLFAPPLSSGLATVRVVSVNGVAAPAVVTGNTLVMDISVSANSAVTIAIAAANIPVGTVVKLIISAETTGDQIITCDPLAGTVASSTGSWSATSAQGVSKALARATW